MRRHRKIRRNARFGRGFAALRLALGAVGVTAAWSGASLAADPDGASIGVHDSVGVWIPDPVETLDAPERLEEPDEAARLRFVAAGGGASAPARRLWWRSGRFDAALAFDAASTFAEGAVLVRAAAWKLAAGGLSLSDLGLAGEVAGIVRRTRTVGPARSARIGDSNASSPPVDRAATGAAVDIDGGLIAWRDRVRLVAGARRRGDGRALALECRLAGLVARGSLVRAEGRDALVGSLGAERTLAKSRGSAEFGTGPAGRFARVGLEARAKRLKASTRYQLESGRDRPGTLDLEAAWALPEVAARIRWRSWSGPAVPRSAGAAAAAPEDDGRAELDLRAGRGDAGAWGLRVGSRPRRADGTGGERYAIGELIVARESGRTLRLTAGRRDAQRAEGWSGGRAIGAVIDLSVPGEPAGADETDESTQAAAGRAAATLTLEAVRADRGTGAYAPGLDVAETGSLRARTRSGVRVAARAWVRIGACKIGAAVDDDDDGASVDETTTGASRAPRVNLWLAWSGGISAR